MSTMECVHPESPRVYSSGLCSRCYNKLVMRRYRARDPQRDLAAGRRWYWANRDKKIKAMAQWRKKNPKKVWGNWLKSRYGLDLAEYDQMMVDQSGRCAVCQRPMAPAYVDHNHSTGRVRGLLCAHCNTRLGYLEQYREQIRAYLNKAGEAL